MATIDLHSSSQVASILAQIYHIALPQDWWTYVTLLDEIINDRPEAQVSYQSLEGWLRQFPAVQLFHHMLKEELTDEGSRTLPATLAAEYPWNTTPVEVVEAYLNFALQRDYMVGQPKCAAAARMELIVIVQAEVSLPGLTNAPASHGDELARRLGSMQIDPSRRVNFGPVVCSMETLDQELADVLESQELPDMMDSMQLE